MSERRLPIRLRHTESVNAILFSSRAPSKPAFATGHGGVSVPQGFSGDCMLFAPDRGPLLIRLGPDSPLDVISMPDPVRIGLAVWSADCRVNVAIRDHIANMNWILNWKNPAGVVFDPLFVRSVAPCAWDSIGVQCAEANKARMSDYYEKCAVNVYYRPDPKRSPVSCEGGDVVFMQRLSPLGSLVHELGHSLGVRGNTDGEDFYEEGHPDMKLGGAAPFTQDNVMFQARNTTLRYHFTLGQIYWMHASSRSVLARFGAQPYARECERALCVSWKEDEAGRRPSPPAAAGNLSPLQSLLLADHISDSELSQRLASKDLAGVDEELASLAENGFGTSELVDSMRTSLKTRYLQITSYYDGGRRPEGRLGSPDEVSFVELHYQQTQAAMRLQAVRGMFVRGDSAGLERLIDKLSRKARSVYDDPVLEAAKRQLRQLIGPSEL